MKTQELEKGLYRILIYSYDPFKDTICLYLKIYECKKNIKGEWLYEYIIKENIYEITKLSNKNYKKNKYKYYDTLNYYLKDELTFIEKL